MIRANMSFCAILSPLDIFSRVAAPHVVMDWPSHSHHEFCLVVDGIPTLGYAGCKVCAEPGTLFLFIPNEAHAVWNSESVTARLWSLEFRIGDSVMTEFSALFERAPERRVLKLSTGKQQWFCNTCQRIAFEKAAGVPGATAASVWLALQLVTVTRWFSAQPDADFVDAREEIDSQCFELWQKIHRHVCQPSHPGPMLFGLNRCHDSLRHRFRKRYGISPQGMLIRLRMNRAKELLRTSNLSIKEIADELGYSRQHDLTRAFCKYTGTSPSDWRMRANGIEENGSETVSEVRPLGV